jgi:hypothetical protein
LRAGPSLRNYFSEAGTTKLFGVQSSIGIGKRSGMAFNLDLSYFPINSKFYAENSYPSNINTKDTLVNFSGRGIFSFRVSTYLLKLSRKRHEMAFGIRFGIDKALGNRKNTDPEFDIREGLNSMNAGALFEYHYYINHKHSIFINAGADANLFGVLDNSSIFYSNSIKGLKPITLFINIGYAFVFLKA